MESMGKGENTVLNLQRTLPLGLLTYYVLIKIMNKKQSSEIEKS